MKKTNVTREVARICQVKLLKGFNVELVFEDGFVKTVNLKKYLHGPAFEQARSDPQYFRQVFIDPIGKTITWPNTADVDADLLRYDLTPAWKEREQDAKRSRRAVKPKPKTEALIPKRVYLYPRQVKLLAKIDTNFSAAIRQVVYTLEK